ncbi:putative RNA recognition motif domain, nucleotide-binding alpha-beta plait domain superfamily [Helianthus annuus]|nr:putative RNA recognition motif domain, nucleotide-binding alpha-beta plait domain superfamily [Helianthus annuus]KAJ0882869.1 putative RNA recognition motif domain, nucleotide-binding alpha-beta plait domain superfamily [Helianthus annuus]
MVGDERWQDPEEWQDVPIRKGRRGVQKEIGNTKVIEKFFVSNLPPKCSSSDLKEFFRGFGMYEGSYIARKFDRLGKRFGFMSFNDVADAKRMVWELADLCLGSYKLFVALARFVDGDKIAIPKDDNVRKGKEKEFVSHANHNVGGSHQGRDFNGGGMVNVDGGGGRTFLDSLLNRNKIDVIQIDENVEGFVQWYDFAVTGKIGWEAEDGGREDSLVEVHGISVPLALDQVFDMAGSRYGEVVKPARMSIEDCNFSYAYIGVLCKSRCRIVDRVDIPWRGEVFNVWIDEDMGEWVPDCVEQFHYVYEEMDRGSEEEQNVELNFENANGDDVELGEIRGDEGSENVYKSNNGVDFFVAGRTKSSAMVGTSVARRKFRRRSLFKNRGDASGSQERPKKRQRDGNDIFGLDKLIGIVDYTPVHTSSVERDSDGDFCTPDLNKRSEEDVVNLEVELESVACDQDHNVNDVVGREPLMV